MDDEFPFHIQPYDYYRQTPSGINFFISDRRYFRGYFAAENLISLEKMLSAIGRNIAATPAHLSQM
jgi:hypothetical protein